MGCTRIDLWPSVNPDLVYLVNLDKVTQILLGVIVNNPVSGSPSLDCNAIEIVLALSYLTLVDEKTAAKKWLDVIVVRVDFSYGSMRNFPVGTDSLDDLVELAFGEPANDRRKELMETSWLLPTLAGWCVIFGEETLYKRVVSGQKEESCLEICSQVWHPLTVDLFDHLYFHQAQHKCGETEAPIRYPETLEEYQKHMVVILASKRHEVVKSSPAFKENLYGLDLLAARHFQTPVPASYWYQFYNVQKALP